MNLKTWLEAHLAGKNPELDLSPDEQDIHGITLVAAIKAHDAWIEQLNNTMREGEQIDPQIVGSDHLCAIGEWMGGKAQEISELKEFAKLAAAHKVFHQCAERVLQLHNEQKFSDALILLRNDLVDTSKQVKSALVALLLAYQMKKDRL